MLISVFKGIIKQIARNNGWMTNPAYKSVAHNAATKIFEGVWSERVFANVMVQTTFPAFVHKAGKISMIAMLVISAINVSLPRSSSWL